jgi:hypothetical protein
MTIIGDCGGEAGMKILMESTPHIVTVDGVECRVWNAVTDNDIQCFVFVHRIAVHNSDDQREFSDLFDKPEAEVMVMGQ